MRVGIGFDAHRFATEPCPLILGGVTVDDARGLAATSDGDVVAHAVTDALLGAAALGDMGMHFPSSDETWHEADSIDMLRRAVALVAEAGWSPRQVDVTVIAQSIPISPHRDQMRSRLADALGLKPPEVSVKATTSDGMGAIGNDEGVAVLAMAVID